MSSFRNYCRRKHKQEPWRHRFGARKHPAACAKFNRGEPLIAEEASRLGISLRCSVCQRATNKKHLPGCGYSARNEVAWDLKRDRRAVAKAAKKATIKKADALLRVLRGMWRQSFGSDFVFWAAGARPKVLRGRHFAVLARRRKHWPSFSGKKTKNLSRSFFIFIGLLRLLCT
jgi:hypothetical protein